MLAFKDAEKQFQDSQKKEGLKIEAAEAGCAAAEARVAQLQNQVSDLESELARVKAAESLQEVHLAVKKDAEAHAEDLQNQLSDMEAHLEEVHQVRADKEKAEQKLQSLQERCAVIEARSSPALSCVNFGSSRHMLVASLCRKTWRPQRPQQTSKLRSYLVLRFSKKSAEAMPREQGLQ